MAARVALGLPLALPTTQGARTDGVRGSWTHSWWCWPLAPQRRLAPLALGPPPWLRGLMACGGEGRGGGPVSRTARRRWRWFWRWVLLPNQGGEDRWRARVTTIVAASPTRRVTSPESPPYHPRVPCALGDGDVLKSSAHHPTTHVCPARVTVMGSLIASQACAAPQHAALGLDGDGAGAGGGLMVAGDGGRLCCTFIPPRRAGGGVGWCCTW